MERLVIAAPPRQEAPEGLGGLLVMAIPMLGSVGSIVLVSTMNGAGGRQYVAAGMFLFATLGFVAVQADRQRAHRRTRTGGARTAYARHLSAARSTIRAAAAAQRAQVVRHHPDPAALVALVADGSRVHERGPGHPCFLQVRWGVAPRPLDLDLVAPADDTTSSPDPASVAAVRRLLTVHARLPDLPVVVDLSTAGALQVSRPTARALVAAAAALHSPAHVSLAVLADDRGLVEWDWVKWLPHVAPGDLDRTHQIVVVDGADLPSERPGVTVLHVGPHTVGLDGRPDACSREVAEAVARRLADRTPTVEGPTTCWAPRPDSDRLRVAIGTTDDGRPLELDLKESAEQGMGPHGLLVGATGSGKSELLRTLVLRLATTHPPDRLNLVLVDFKGGATFAGLAGLPHVSALVTNLVDDLSLVDRMHDALAGELVRRQELLRAAGADSVRDCPELPPLLVVVDEFAELLAARPELLELFVTIGRLGRSLGLHLLLASQRLDEGRLRGLEPHLSYRIGLRTFSAEESRSVLGVPDAYELPAVPGVGFLRTGPSAPARFLAAYVSGPVPHRPAAEDERGPFTLAGLLAAGSEPAPAPRGTTLDVAVRAMTGRGRAAHRIWLPPLDESPDLEDLVARWGAPPSRLEVPIGVVDRPREQRRDPLVVDLSGAAGHVAVAGGPRSGKTQALRSLVCALAMRSTPRELGVVVLDLGDGSLAVLEALPHVRAVARRSEPDAVRRVLAEVTRMVERREAGEEDRCDVVLVVDGWAVLRELDDFGQLESQVQQLATRGLAVGLHVVAATNRWTDLRPSVRDLFGTRLELRLGDPVDSEVDRRAAGAVPHGRPGRGLVDGPLHVLTAVAAPGIEQRIRGGYSASA